MVLLPIPIQACSRPFVATQKLDSHVVQSFHLGLIPATTLFLIPLVLPFFDLLFSDGSPVFGTAEILLIEALATSREK